MADLPGCNFCDISTEQTCKDECKQDANNVKQNLTDANSAGDFALEKGLSVFFNDRKTSHGKTTNEKKYRKH